MSAIDVYLTHSFFFFRDGLSLYYPSIAAWAAAMRAIGTRKGEQLT